MSNDDIVIASIIAVFVVFMITLGSVAWWSNQAPKVSKTVAKLSNQNDMDANLSASR
jgi:uncharacterized membrane protein